MVDHGFKFFIAIGASVCVFIVALGVWIAPDGSPAAVHRASLYDALPSMVQDTYVGLTLANMTRLACVNYEWIKAAGLYLSSQISVFATHTSNFLKFFVTTMYSWSLRQKPYIDTAVVRAAGTVHGATTILTEIIDTANQLHSRLEKKASSTAAYCVDGVLAFAVLILLLIISGVMMVALRSVVNHLYNAGRRVHWKGLFWLSVASIVGYVGFLWTKVQ